MARQKTSITLSDDEVGIVDATARRMGISRSEVMRHLILYQGLCGGDFPVTSKILGLAPKDYDRIVAEIRTRAESEDPIKPQSFREWVKEVLGRNDNAVLSLSGELLLKEMMKGKKG